MHTIAVYFEVSVIHCTVRETATTKWNTRYSSYSLVELRRGRSRLLNGARQDGDGVCHGAGLGHRRQVLRGPLLVLDDRFLVAERPGVWRQQQTSNKHGSKHNLKHVGDHYYGRSCQRVSCGDHDRQEGMKMSTALSTVWQWLIKATPRSKSLNEFSRS